MKVTEVRIKLTGETDDRLLAFCSVTFDDCFVVRDLKIIDGSTGPFVAMPSRKLTTHCPSCRCKNHLRSSYCNQCGADMRSESSSQGRDGHQRLYADIAHPINSGCREMIQKSVIAEFEKELELAQLPGYRSRYDDDYEHVEDGRDLEKRGAGESRRSRPAEQKKSPEKKSPEKIGPEKISPEKKKHRSDDAEQQLPRGTHQSPHQSEKSSDKDEPDEPFGAGIL